MSKTKIGYARVSSDDQSNVVQVERLKAAGCAFVREEKVSGAGRDELARILDFLRAGDELVVVRLDRLGRNTRDVLNLVHELESRGASLRVLEPEFSTAHDTGRLLVTVLGMVAEMERRFIKERQAAGIAKAKAAGIYKGRPRSIDAEAVRKLAAESKGATEIAAALGIGRASVYRALREAADVASYEARKRELAEGRARNSSRNTRL